MSKHTPGPYHIGLDMPDGIWIMAGHLHVATIPRARDGDWSRDNANMFAAAPEMADELAEAALQIEYLHDKFQKTGTGNAVLDRIRRLLDKIDGAP